MLRGRACEGHSREKGQQEWKRLTFGQFAVSQSTKGTFSVNCHGNFVTCPQSYEPDNLNPETSSNPIHPQHPGAKDPKSPGGSCTEKPQVVIAGLLAIGAITWWAPAPAGVQS